MITACIHRPVVFLMDQTRSHGRLLIRREATAFQPVHWGRAESKMLWNVSTITTTVGIFVTPPIRNHECDLAAGAHTFRALFNTRPFSFESPILIALCS